MPANRNFNQRNIGILCMFMHCFFISTSSILLKIIQNHYHITQIIFLYNFIICSSLLCISFFSKKSLLKISTNNIKYHFLRSIFGFGGFLLFFYSLSNMPITETRAIIAIDPLLTSLLAVFFFKEAIDTKKIVAFLITFAGAIILLHPSNIEFSIASFAALLAALCFGIFNNITKRITSGKTIEQMFYLSFFSLIYTFFPAALYWKRLMLVSDGFFIVLISLTFALSSFCAFHAFKRADLSLLMPIHFTGIVMTAILGILVFNEKVGYLTILGSFIIIIGTIPLFYKKI